MKVAAGTMARRTVIPVAHPDHGTSIVRQVSWLAGQSRHRPSSRHLLPVTCWTNGSPLTVAGQLRFLPDSLLASIAGWKNLDAANLHSLCRLSTAPLHPASSHQCDAPEPPTATIVKGFPSTGIVRTSFRLSASTTRTSECRGSVMTIWPSATARRGRGSRQWPSLL